MPPQAAAAEARSAFNVAPAKAGASGQEVATCLPEIPAFAGMTRLMATAKAAHMKLASFNINGIRARLPRLIEWLDREKPDVACLQELKCADEALPIADIEAAGYGAVWHGQKGFNGVAILVKGDTPELRRVGLPGDPDDTHSRYIEAEVKLDGGSAAGGMIVASLYLPNGNPIGT